MGDNYVDVPCLVLKLLAAGTIAAGYFLKGADTGGYAQADAGDSASAVGMMAMESAADNGYFDALIIGTAYATLDDSTYAGDLLAFGDSPASFIDATADRSGIATLLDGCDTAAATSNPCGTRMHRVFIWGAYFTPDTIFA